MPLDFGNLRYICCFPMLCGLLYKADDESSAVETGPAEIQIDWEYWSPPVSAPPTFRIFRLVIIHISIIIIFTRLLVIVIRMIIPVIQCDHM